MKFLITRDVRDRLMPELMPHLRADENAGEGAHYPIVSLYYDSPARDCYWENIHGSKSRRKLRVRVYGSADGLVAPTCFAEIKHKVDGRNVKRRLKLGLVQALHVAAGEMIDSTGLRPIDLRTIEEIHSMVHGKGFVPACCMRYDRHAYAGIDPSNDLRVTFDTGIAYRFDDLQPRPDDRQFSSYINEEGSSVMEVKVTGAAPYWLTRLLGSSGCRMQSHSKYCRALEAGDPILRSLMASCPAAA